MSGVLKGRCSIWDFHHLVISSFQILVEPEESLANAELGVKSFFALMSELSDSRIYLTNPIWLDPEVSPDVSWRCTSQVPLVVEGETSHPCSCGLLTKVVAIQASFRHSNTCWGMSLGIGWLSSKPICLKVSTVIRVWCLQYSFGSATLVGRPRKAGSYLLLGSFVTAWEITLVNILTFGTTGRVFRIKILLRIRTR